MSPRTGRPKTEKPKIFEVKARIDEDLNNKLIEYCKKNNIRLITIKYNQTYNLKDLL